MMLTINRLNQEGEIDKQGQIQDKYLRLPDLFLNNQLAE